MANTLKKSCEVNGTRGLAIVEHTCWVLNPADRFVSNTSISMLQIQTIPVTGFQQNCRLLIDDASNESVLIDPGGEADYLHGLVAESGSTLQSIVLTHSHLDHCGGVAGLLNLNSGLAMLGHEIEAKMRASISQHAAVFGMSPDDFPNCPEPTEYIDDGYVMRVGSYEAVALFTPGHSPGHLSFFFETADYSIDGSKGTGPVLIAGDALFNGSIGRTDLPGGNGPQLIESIKTRLLPLPDETIVLCGHGPETTIGNERASNPFLQ